MHREQSGPVTPDAVNETDSQEELEVRDANRVIDRRLLHMHYQPIVDLRTREIFAQEALCRPRSRRLKSPMDLVAAAVRRQPGTSQPGSAPKRTDQAGRKPAQHSKRQKRKSR